MWHARQLPLQDFADAVTTTHAYSSPGCYVVSARALEAATSSTIAVPSVNIGQSSTWVQLVKVCGCGAEGLLRCR
jgi:hypothetical protein